jgi:hypothetical protein
MMREKYFAALVAQGIGVWITVQVSSTWASIWNPPEA